MIEFIKRFYFSGFFLLSLLTLILGFYVNSFYFYSSGHCFDSKISEFLIHVNVICDFQLIMEAQDDQMDRVADSVTVLKHMGKTIGNEFDEQAV